MPTSKLQHFGKIQAEKRNDKIVIPLAKEYLLSKWQTEYRDPWNVHPSEMAKKDWCHRGTYFRMTTGQWPEENFNFVLQSIFDEGHQIHDKWQQWLRGTGKLWGLWECSICHEQKICMSRELDYCWSRQIMRPDKDGADEDYCPLGYGEPLAHMWEYKEVPLAAGIIAGHEDGAIEDRLVEIKSVGLGTLRHDSPDLLAKFYNKQAKLYDLEGVWKAMQAPLKSHVRQTNVYLYLAREMGLSYSKASIIYEYKPNQQSREYVISLSEDVLAPMLDKVEDIEYALKVGKPPPCPYGACKQCQGYETSVRDRRGSRHDSSRSPRAGASGSQEAKERDSGPTPRRDRASRQCSDEAFPPTDGVAEVPGNANGACRSGRKVLVKKASKDREEL